MGQVFAYIIAMLFAICAGAVFLLFIAADFVRTREYNHAYKTMAKVQDYMGVHKTANYGKYARSCVYHKYAVTFIVDGRLYNGEHLVKNESLVKGQDVLIRYTKEKDGTAKIVNRDIRDRFYRFLLCVIIAVPVCILCVILFK